jgi:RNA polymerase sigma-70 factor, ECF subfamily
MYFVGPHASCAVPHSTKDPSLNISAMDVDRIKPRPPGNIQIGELVPGSVDPTAEEFQRTALVHLEAVYRLAYAFARNAAKADDLTQETFLHAWQSFQRFDRSQSCRAWLCGILHHVWSHERRRMDREPIVFDPAAVRTDALLYDPPTPDTLTEEEVLAAFDALPDALRETVLLADVEELTYREIATILSIPIGTVMSRLNRGRKLLRHQLAAYAQSRGIGRSSEESGRRKTEP